MRQANLQESANAVLNRDAVQFDQNVRYSKEKEWPFWYAFIPKRFLNESGFRGGLGPLGWSIAPGETKDIHIKTQRDCAYRFLGIKYTPYICIRGASITGGVETTVGTNILTGDGTAFLTDLTVGQTIILDIDNGPESITVSIKSITSDTIAVLDQIVNVFIGEAQDYFKCTTIWYDRTLPQTKSDLSDLTNVTLTQTNAPGTISIPATSTAITGVSTLMDTGVNDLLADDIIEYRNDANQSILNSIAAVASDLLATLGISNVSLVTAQNYKRVANVQTGTITVTAATGVIVGVGTTFTGLSVGQTIYYVVGGVVVTGTIAVINTNANMEVNLYPGLTDAAAVNFALGIGTQINPSLPLPTNNFRFNPVYNLLRVTLIQVSLQNRYYYGGLQYKPGSGLIERPMNVSSLQGINDGMGFIRTMALLPTESTIIVRITNISDTETIIVNGNTFGYKVSLNELSKY